LPISTPLGCELSSFSDGNTLVPQTITKTLDLQLTRWVLDKRCDPEFGQNRLRVAKRLSAYGKNIPPPKEGDTVDKEPIVFGLLNPDVPETDITHSDLPTDKPQRVRNSRIREIPEGLEG
jgi:hypothetical protein